MGWLLFVLVVVVSWNTGLFCFVWGCLKNRIFMFWCKQTEKIGFLVLESLLIFGPSGGGFFYVLDGRAVVILC
jgi:hypothetical protein